MRGADLLTLDSAPEFIEFHDGRLVGLTSSESVLVMSFDHLVVYLSTADENVKRARGFRALTRFFGVASVDARGTLEVPLKVSEADFSRQGVSLEPRSLAFDTDLVRFTFTTGAELRVTCTRCEIELLASNGFSERWEGPI